MRTIAVIHARGGSKRIPLKNIKLLNGVPLIAYMVRAAQKASSIERVILSSDHPEIIRIAKENGAEVPFVRPAPLAEDVASELVTKHAVDFLKEQEGYDTDIVVTMQPTTPFCLPEDINGAVEMLKSAPVDELDSVFSAYPVHERPEWMFRIDDKGYAGNFLNMVIQGDTGISQCLPKLYCPNGGIYATRTSVLYGQNLLIGKKSKIWFMPRERSVDIDDPIDFEFAEFLARKISLNNNT